MHWQSSWDVDASFDVAPSWHAWQVILSPVAPLKVAFGHATQSPDGQGPVPAQWYPTSHWQLVCGVSYDSELTGQSEQTVAPPVENWPPVHSSQLATL